MQRAGSTWQSAPTPRPLARTNVVLETLAQAYWMNRDRAGAVKSIEQAPALIDSGGSSPNRVHNEYEKELASYRNDALGKGCPARPPKP